MEALYVAIGFDKNTNSALVCVSTVTLGNFFKEQIYFNSLWSRSVFLGFHSKVRTTIEKAIELAKNNIAGFAAISVSLPSYTIDYSSFKYMNAKQAADPIYAILC